MTDIAQIPFTLELENFLNKNGIYFVNKEDAYDQLLDLLERGDAKGYPVSVVEWLMAHNLLVNEVDIPYYTSFQIDNMSQDEIIELARLLTMKGNNRNNIKNILNYLKKLDVENISLNFDEKSVILDIYWNKEKDLLKDIRDKSCKDIISLLETHPNKQMIRNLIKEKY